MKNELAYSQKNRHSPIVYEMSTLPELEGSDKQVEWAKGIRYNLLNGHTTICSQLKAIESRKLKTKFDEIIAPYVVAEIIKRVHETSAAVWIDRRSGNCADFCIAASCEALEILKAAEGLTPADLKALAGQAT